MPDKEGSEDNKTKSVVSKKQKQMMGEEGYDIARDMGRVKPSKDKKDATTMPPSKEMEKTRKVNKGPSALDIVKKKYKGQIMKMEELDLSKVAESFGGYIVEAPMKSLTGDPEEIESRIKKAAAEKRKKNIQKAQKNLAKDAGIKLKTQSPEQAAATQAAKDIGQKDLTPDVRQGMRSVAAGKGKAEPKDQLAATSGGKKKGEFKSPKLSPTTGGRKITKRIVKKIDKTEADRIERMGEPKTRSQKITMDRADAREAGRRFQRDFKPKGKKFVGPPPTGDIGFNAPDRAKKIKKRETRAIKQGTPDPFTTPTPKKPIRPFGDKPVAGGLPMDPTRTYTTTKGGVKTTKVFDPSKPPKRTPIPKDTGSLADAPKVKKRFSQLSKDIKGLKTDIKVDKDIEKNIARVDRGKKISKGADFSGVSRRTGAMKSGQKVTKQLGRTPKLGGSVLKVVGKETKQAAAKTAAKQITKTAGKKALQKGIAKAVAKQIPGIGSLISGAEAGARALKGDFKGAALSAGEAIPGVGLGFAGANIARDVKKAKKAASAVKTVTKAKRAKDAVKVVTPTVVGSRADKFAQAKKGISDFAKTPTGAATVIGGGALAGKGIEKNVDPRKIKAPAVKGGKTGFRSAKS